MFPTTHLGLVIVGHFNCGKSTMINTLLCEMDNLQNKSKKETETVFNTMHCSYAEFVNNNYHYTLIDTPGHKNYLKQIIKGISQGHVVLLVVSAIKHEFKRYKLDTIQYAKICHAFGIEQMVVCINKMDHPKVNYSEDIYRELKWEMDIILTKIGFKTKKIAFIPISAWKADNIIKNAGRNKIVYTRRRRRRYRQNDDSSDECGGSLFGDDSTDDDSSSEHENPSSTDDDNDDLWNQTDDSLETMKWWNGYSVKIKMERIEGRTLFDALEKNIRRQKMANKKPFKLSVFDVNDNIIIGRIEEGKIQIGEYIKCIINGYIGKIVSIEMNHRNIVDVAMCGYHVGLNMDGLQMMPHVGEVMMAINDNDEVNILKNVKQFTATVFLQAWRGKFYSRINETIMTGYCRNIFKYRIISSDIIKLCAMYCCHIYPGFEGMLHVRSASCECQLISINWRFSKATNNQKVCNPKYVEGIDHAELILRAKSAIVVSQFDECKSFGRIVVTKSNELIMVGRISSIN